LRDIQEITLEANPEDITTESLQTWKGFKIDRLSIGVQSLNEAELTFMNRNHNAIQSKAAIELAIKSNFKNITIDYIYGSPWKTDEDWKSELNWALNAGITHLSAYALTVEPKTQLANQISKNILPPPTDERMESQFNILQEFISKNGWEAYEISNYCKPEHRAVHNSNYWAGKPYLGVGPSAHSFDGQNSRRWNVSNNSLYMKGVENETVYWENEELTFENKFNEYLMTKLRTKEGIDLNYIDTINTNWKKNQSKNIDNLSLNGNITVNNNALYLTNNGKLISDHIISLLMI
jgi:oxygen-independent coproporphyrinogen-3 oxidase